MPRNFNKIVFSLIRLLYSIKEQMTLLCLRVKTSATLHVMCVLSDDRCYKCCTQATVDSRWLAHEQLLPWQTVRLALPSFHHTLHITPPSPPLLQIAKMGNRPIGANPLVFGCCCWRKRSCRGMTKDLTYIDLWPGPPFRLGWLVAHCNSLDNWSLW
jgi:hypothetical protein